MGKISLILGCMRSGKTTALIAEWHKWHSISKNAICINYAEDVRYNNSIPSPSAGADGSADGGAYGSAAASTNAAISATNAIASIIPENIIKESLVYSHDLLNVKCINTLTLAEIHEVIIAESPCNVILINEGQFFPDLLEYVVMWCEKYNKNILISGLDGDYLRKPFGQILDLIPYANKVKKLKAFCSVCKDGTYAHFTKRISEDVEQKIIGNDIYVSVCRKHYLER